MLGINSRSDFSTTNQQIRSSLQEDITRDKQRLKTWVRNRESAITNLANMASTRTPQQMQPYLEHTRKSDLNLRRVGLHDQSAKTIAYTPLVDELGNRTIGISYADRPFIPTLRQNLKPMLSEVSQSRIGLSKPRVLLIAPVVSHGAYNGYVSGILSLDQLRGHLDKSTAHNAKLYTLIDKNSNVIMSNRPDQQMMALFTRPAGKLTRVDAQISQWIPQLPPNTPISERWQKSFYVMEAAVGDLAEWKLILEQPIAPFQKALYEKYTGSLTVLFVILLGSLALAELLSRKANITLEQLLTITKDLPARMASTAPGIAWPDSCIAETNQLIANFQVTSDSLASQFREIQQINEQLELRVQERTANLDVLNVELMAELANSKLIEDELRKSEERFRKMIESSPNLVMIHSAGIFTYLNPTAVATFGADSRDQLLNTPVMERVHPDYRTLERERVKAITEQGSQASTIEVQLLRLDDSAFYASVTTMPFEMEGNPAVLTIAVDISARKRVEKELLELNDTLEQQVASRTKELEATNKDLASFSYSISHELRAPIARLEGFSRILTECVANAETDNLQHYAERIGFSSRRLMTVVDSLLLMNRIPRLQLQRESVDLTAMSREIYLELQEDCTRRHFQVEIDSNMMVQGDRTMLQVCMQNLLGNAFKYSMKIADPAIIVGVTVQDNRTVYFVRDNGAGFDMAFVSKLFQPFSRLHNDHEFEGNGIGLATVQKIIEKHGGQIWADASPGAGATFFFTLG
jgi:PAS domain S-box-containing protein